MCKLYIENFWPFKPMCFTFFLNVSISLHIYCFQQVHLIKSEEFFQDPVNTLNDLFTFLNISTAETEALVKSKPGKIWKYYTGLIQNVDTFL